MLFVLHFPVVGAQGHEPVAVELGARADAARAQFGCRAALVPSEPRERLAQDALLHQFNPIAERAFQERQVVRPVGEVVIARFAMEDAPKLR
jgi:hypothetical protein